MHPGRFQEAEWFPVQVYGREGESCGVCHRAIRRIAQGGRSTYYCPGCQKKAQPPRSKRTISVIASQSRAKEFRSLFTDRVFVADGAMGTMFYSKGVFINRCYDELNLTAPSMVREIHQDYVKAGAEILE